MAIREVAASLYAWDIADEGVEAILDKLVEHAAVNSVYLVGVMHKEKRPFTSMFYAQDPKRSYYLPEDSRIYYRFEESSFSKTRLRPLGSDRDFLKGTDWLEALTKAARKRGLRTGVELSHTIADNTMVLQECPQALQRTIDGEAIPGHLCPNSPDSREYIKALFRDTVQNHDIDFIQTCMLLFSPGRPCRPPWFVAANGGSTVGHLLGVVQGGCFCENCAAAAKRMGSDWEGIVDGLQPLVQMARANMGSHNEAVVEQGLLLSSDLLESGLLLEIPALYQFLQFRARSTTELFSAIYAAVKQVRPSVEFRYNNHRLYPELVGVCFPAVRDFLDSVRDSDYSAQRGAPDGFARKRATLAKVRRGIGFDKPLIAGVAVRPKATPELVRRSICVVNDMGVDGLSLGHYDGSTMALLDAVRQGLEEAGAGGT
jgi:hypothetical protein